LAGRGTASEVILWGMPFDHAHVSGGIGRANPERAGAAGTTVAAVDASQQWQQALIETYPRAGQD
jgi:hypothetical protein